MRKSCVFLLIITLCSSLSFAQSKKSVSILGDSYSTFEGYLQPDTNSIWYYTIPRHKTDVVSVRQTWWHQFIKENDYRLCVNNSFRELPFAILDTVRQITPTVPLSLVWMNWDVRMSFLFLVLRMTVGRVLPSENINTADGPKRICTDSVPLWLICSTT